MGFCVKVIVMFFFQVYKFLFSDYMGWNCRFYPTCSNYGLECYQKYNFFLATKFTFFRFLTCIPFGPQGYDPVPTTKLKKVAQ